MYLHQKHYPVLNRKFNPTIGGYSINYPKFLTPKEYESMVLKESIRNYYKKKLDAIDGKVTRIRMETFG